MSSVEAEAINQHYQQYFNLDSPSLLKKTHSIFTSSLLLHTTDGLFPVVLVPAPETRSSYFANIKTVLSWCPLRSECCTDGILTSNGVYNRHINV
jgi:hypothetical protein